MNEIKINRKHIRQIVKEALENLMLGEDNIINKNEYIINFLKNIDFDNMYYEELNVKDEYSGYVEIIGNKNEDDSYCVIYMGFDIDGEYEDYSPETYYNPSSGGVFRVDDIKPSYAKIEIYDYNIKQGEEVKIIEDLDINNEIIFNILDKMTRIFYSNVEDICAEKFVEDYFVDKYSNYED